MASPDLPPYVAEAGFNRWIVKRVSGVRWSLEKLGFRSWLILPNAHLHRRRKLSFEEMGRLASAIRDLGIPFSAGHGWSPAEVVRDLRDRGLFEGEFLEIAWTGPGWVVRSE